MSGKTVDNSFGSDMEAVVNLMTGRCTGAINDDSVEDAISKLLSRTIPSAPSLLPQNVPTVVTAHRQAIFQDMGCYDNDDDEEEEFQQESAIPKPTLEPTEKLSANQQKCDVDWDDIPLGYIGCFSRLMQTFGDGPIPKPDAVSTTLAGTRQLLHMAIKDARALRRKMKLAFLQAKSQVTGRDQVKIHNRNRTKRTSTSTMTISETDEKTNHPTPSSVDAELQFQAFGGISKISYDPPCGFDEEQIEKLFPEEMYAYRRWKSMHKAATDNSNSNVLDKKQILKGSSSDATIDGDLPASIEGQDVENDEDDVAVEVENDPKDWGGYLQSRLSQFDARTEQMKDDFYLKFSEVRRGSFLPPSFLNQDEKIWEKLRKENRPRGRLNLTLSTWETLPAQHVPFLHWLGFSPRSALPLPSEVTTHALAFLAYDFFGKIVEKAVFLRCLKDSETTHRTTTKDGRIILELQADEQLTKEDIELAMNDSTLASKPLYRASGDIGRSLEAAQLYFGPGFEDRLEVELDQIMLKKMHDKEVSQEENSIRIQEDDLFENLQNCKPVKLTSIMTLRSDGVGPQQSTTSKRVLRTGESIAQKRPRGRPRKQEPVVNENKSI